MPINPKFKNILALWLIILGIVLIVGSQYWYYIDDIKPILGNSDIVCTKEAEQCPDGSYVGRAGSNCEFAKCPDVGLGRCVQKFKAVSGPELTASEAYSSECTSKTSQSDCERVDIYNEANGNFGNADGMPDCKWIAESSSIDTSTWKTYRNEKYGFEVRHPPNLITLLPRSNSYLVEVQFVEEGSFVHYLIPIVLTITKCEQDISICIGKTNLVYKTKPINLGGIEYYTSSSWGGRFYIHGAIKNNNFLYNIAVKSSNDFPNLPTKEDEIYFNQILSTFKFLK